MRILFVANLLDGHIKKFHIPSIKKMKENGWTVDVACGGEGDLPECDTHFKCCWGRNPFSFKVFKGIFQLRKIIKNGDYDIVYCHTPVGGVVARLAASKARKNGTKVVYFAHGFHFYKGCPVVNKIIYYPIEKLLAHKTDLLITLNDEDYNNAKTKFTKKLKVEQVPGIGANFERLNIADPASARQEYRKQLGISEDETALIYVAELIKNKNQIMLIDALKKLSDDGERCKLILVGPDFTNGAYEKYARAVGIEEKVCFLGWRSDVGELLTASDICVASSRREGLPINLFEAMYCRLPVVATENRGHTTALKNGENGLLIPANDVDALVASVKSLSSDYELYNKLSNIDVTSYGTDKVTDLIVRNLEQVKK